MVVLENCTHLGVVVHSVHNNSGLALVCWNNDNVGVIPKGTDRTALPVGYVGFGWFGFLQYLSHFIYYFIYTVFHHFFISSVCAGDEKITCSVSGCACTLMATRVHEGWLVLYVLVLFVLVLNGGFEMFAFIQTHTCVCTRANMQSIAQNISCPTPPTCPPGSELETNTVPGQCCPMYNCTELSESHSPPCVCITCICVASIDRA